METKQELVTFVIPFDEVYGEVYGIPTINDLDINGYGVYNTSKWPSEIKEFVTAFASDDDVISIPGYAAWDRYNLDRAKEFVNIYQRLLGKYIDFVEVKFDKFDYGTLFATVDRFDLIKEFADKYEIAQDETDPAKIVEAVCNFILDKENLNYDDIAKEAENTRTVKSNYTLSLQALKDEFEFEPELTSINDLCNYAKVGDKFVWVADAPGQQKLQFEKKENKMQIDKEVLAILNEEFKKGPVGEYFTKDYPEGTLFEDWNSGVICFQILDANENSLNIFAPEHEYGDQWGANIIDVDGNSLIDPTNADTKQVNMGDWEIDDVIQLKTEDWETARTKLKQILLENPKALKAFGDFEVPAEAIDLMIKYNKLKDAGQNPVEVFKILEIN